MKQIFDKIHPRIMMLISGLLLGTTLIFADIGILAYIFLIPLAIALYKRADGGNYKVRMAYLDGFVFFMGLDIVGFHWITYFYPLDFAGLSNVESLVVILLGWIGLSLLQSVFSALVFVIISRFIKTEIYKRYPLLLAPFAAAMITVNEWTQTFTWAGVPWSRVGISQTSMPIMMQTASLFGSYFLTFVIVLFNFLVAYAILKADKRRFVAILALAVFCGNFILSATLYFIPSHNEDRAIKVASVQGNIESKNISSMAELANIIDVHRKQTRKAVEDGAELVIWAEGTMPINIHDYIGIDGGYKKLSDVVSDLAKELGVTIVLGSYVDFEGGYNNSISAFYADGSTNINAYAKRRPVPFGEYLPMSDVIMAIIPLLAEINIFSEVTPGETATVFDADISGDPIKVGTLICFDSIYERIGIDSARAGAEMFIIPSNDAWFYDSRALYMHACQNTLRAVEQGKYVVNCGNSGITSIVNAKGETLVTMPIFTEGYVIDTVYASSGRTLYSYIGNLFVYVCIAAAIVPFGFELYFALKKRRIG